MYDIDYSRYVPFFERVLQRSFSSTTQEVVTAVQLVSFLGMQSQTKALVKLAHDRDYHVRAAVAKALADFGGPDVVPVLAEMVDSTEEARRGLVCMGDCATATIVGMIAQGDSGDQRNAEHLVRAYIDHWLELPGPIDHRIVEAAREGLQKMRGKDRTEYYERFLELVASDPIPAGDLSCRLDQWTAFCPTPMRLIHGWYVVADGRIMEHAAAPAPDADTRVFRIVFKTVPADGRLKLEAGWNSPRWTPGGPPATKVDQRQIDVPAGLQFEVAYDCHQQRPFANGRSAVRLTRQFRTLWEGRFIKDGQVVKRVVYVARVVRPDDPARQFEPPTEPAPAKGEPIRPRENRTFRGLSLSDADKVSDPAILHDIQVAWKNHTIKTEGGKVSGSTHTELVFETVPADAPGERFAVFWDRTKNVFYIQEVTRQSGPGTGVKVEYFGPIAGNSIKKLTLPAEKEAEPVSSDDTTPITGSAHISAADGTGKPIRGAKVKGVETGTQ